jgi:hypothetical protein
MIVLSMSNAALLMTVGVLGEYVAKIFEEGKGRPLYIVADAWNVTQKPERANSARSEANLPRSLEDRMLIESEAILRGRQNRED